MLIEKLCSNLRLSFLMFCSFMSSLIWNFLFPRQGLFIRRLVDFLSEINVFFKDIYAYKIFHLTGSRSWKLKRNLTKKLTSKGSRLGQKLGWRTISHSYQTLTVSTRCKTEWNFPRFQSQESTQLRSITSIFLNLRITYWYYSKTESLINVW